MNIIKQLKIRMEIEKICPSLTKNDRILLGNIIIENYELKLSKL